MPGRHPDDDVLADLAADVLPPGEARAVENHVLACERCAGLLEDAERLRGLLLAGDPGPVPADVWHRVEAALAAEGVSRSPAAATAGPPPVADTAAFQAFVDAPTSIGRAVLPAPGSAHAAEEAAPAWVDEGDPLDDPARWSGPRGGRGARTAGGSTRRDGREGRQTRPRRRGPVLLAAAAAVGVIAVVGAVQLAGPGSSSSSDATMSAGSGTGPATAEGGGTPQDAAILRSGRAYRQSTLAEQAQGLLAASAARAKALAQAQGADPSSPPRANPAAGGLATVAPDTDADDVTNPSRLAACLKQLGVGADRLVAVDLATYDGREAAILLLLSPEGGGHEVWAVERTCGEGSEGALHYTRVRD